MHSKKTLIRVFIRTLYAGGFIFLVAGLLLSVLSTNALASGTPALDLAASPTWEQQTPPNCNCNTATPSRTPILETKTGTPATPRPTHPPLDFNLSSICGYTYDNYELWKVANNTGDEATYTWQVIGSNEAGSGQVAANSSTYFTTSAGQKTVRLYVQGQLVDTESCLQPCKKELQLSYACTSSGLTWQVTNTNSFGVDYTVKVDNKAAGKGVLKANSTDTVATTSSGAHTVEVTWTDTRPGTHTVTLSSPVNSCVETAPTATPTPVYTSTLPVNTETPVPTFTSTLPVNTETPVPTFTSTPQVVTSTATPGSEIIPTVTETPTTIPTATATQPFVTITPTVTLTQPAATSTFTLTPTITLTPSGGSISTVTSTPVTPTATSPATATVTLTPSGGSISTVTSTPITPTATSVATATNTLPPQGGIIPSATPLVTLPPPVVVVTSTPVLIPVTGADMTRPIGASSLNLFAGLFTNVGLFTLGLALALTGITSQMKD